MKDAITLAGSTTLAAMASLEGAARARGYDNPEARLSVGGHVPFWLTLTVSESLHEFFYGPDLGVQVSSAEAWIESLPPGDSFKRSLAPWFELAQ